MNIVPPSSIPESTAGQGAAGRDALPASCQSVVSVYPWTPRLRSFTITRPSTFDFSPGQYARLGLGDDPRVWRPFSMVSGRNRPHLEFVAALIADGAFSAHLQALQPGDPIWLDASSYGFLTVDQLAAGTDLWLLASGTGLGPYLSLLQEASTWTDFRHLILVHSVRRRDELIYKDAILALQGDKAPAAPAAQLTYLPIVTGEPASSGFGARMTTLLEDGRLETAAGRVLDPRDSRVMVCGNPEMSRELRLQLASRGFATTRRGIPGQMVFEKYW